MNNEDFAVYLKKGRRSAGAIKRATTFVAEYETYLAEHKDGVSIDQASPQDLEDFALWIERKPKASAKTHLWAIRYYYHYIDSPDMKSNASMLREQRIKRTPFRLRDFRGVNQEYADALAGAGIKNVKQMLDAGLTPTDRAALAEETGVPSEAILEFVKLSDLARIPGIKAIRAHLYYDAGIDTIEVMAGWDPEELLRVTREFVERTGFDGIAPLPGEARFSIERAKQLPKIVVY